MELDEITGQIIDAAIDIHRVLGPGLLESVYFVVLCAELRRRGFTVETQKAISFTYNGMTFSSRLRVDMIVNGVVVVELKSVEKLLPLHSKQVLTYLRMLDLRVGLLLNFGEETLRSGLRRIVNNLDPSASPRLRVNK